MPLGNQLGSNDIGKIERWHDSLTDDIRFELALPQDDRRTVFQQFADRFTEAASRVRFKKRDTESGDLPGVHFRNTAYHAVPHGPELEPFLALIADHRQLSGVLPDTVRNQLTAIKLPALLKIFIAPTCPHCPKAVTKLLAIAAECSLVQLSIIDGQLFDEIAAQDGIQAVPTVILDKQFRWSGNIDPDEMLKVLIDRDPTQLSALALQTMLGDGRAADLAQLMVDFQTIIPSFLDLLVHKKWSVRLGAMVAFESLAETDPTLTARLIQPLWEQFATVDDQTKGDLLYLLGKSGDKGQIPQLEKILAGSWSSEIKEAASDAIADIQSED